MLASPRSRFLATLGLFALWLGFLTFLAATSAQTPRHEHTPPTPESSR